MRTLGLGAALLCAVVLAAPVGAQSEMPTELWSEFPLQQTVERTEPGTASGAETRTAIGPFLPPDPNEAAAPADSTRWSLWLALLGLAAVAIVFAARTVSPVAASGLRHVGGVARGRRARTRPRRPIRVGGRPAPAMPRQYAPPRPRDEETSPEPGVRRSVIRQTGFLRSHFVILAGEPGGEVTEVGRSRSFWTVGRAERREQAAVDAWSELLDELRADGWEVDTPQSAYYVTLYRDERAPVSVLPTIEAYMLTPEEPDER